MEKYLVVCEKFKFLDKFLQSILKTDIKENNIYRMIKDETGLHICLPTETGERFIYLTDLKSDSDPRYKYSFKRIDFEDLMYNGTPNSEDPKGDLNWITSDHNPFKAFEKANKIEEDEVLLEYEIEEEGTMLSDEEFLISIFKDMRNQSLDLAEGFLNSVEYSSDAFIEYSTPESSKKAIEKIKEEVDNYKTSGNPFHLGMAQLVLYYLFRV